MTKVFKAGEVVTVALKDDDTDWTLGLTGSVIAQKSKTTKYGWHDNLDVLVEFSKKDAKGRGHSDNGGGRYSTGADNRWWIDSDNLDTVEDVIVLGTDATATPHFKNGSQTSFILGYLLKGKSITNLESLNYGIYRLSDCIHKIRGAGFDVITTVKQDAVGRKYASYSLPAKAA